MHTEEFISTTDVLTTAGRFINSTSAPIFLTGKAGTGKTTFLKSLAGSTHKSFIVVAPTGIAALNAGGTTIHSQFLLPFGMFIPERSTFTEFSQGSNFYTSDALARKHPLNSVRKQVLRSIDLLVIDEVSMLRADLLDAIDYRLKAARGNFRQPFGGVQLLLIGDLFQLPPVVKREEEATLSKYYNSSWFFESHALKQSGFVYIELDKIFRQSDRLFIDLLNNLRNNCPTTADIDELNKHYTDSETIRHMREVITLTTHNYKADDLNQRALKSLETASHIFQASVEGDFPESMYPVLAKLELKEGAQIMFVKNDTEDKAYFNGKLATVKTINGDGVTVEMSETGTPYKLKKAIWENKRYSLSSDAQHLEEEVIGSFEQYPVKLAWAITVHKSQGLTFDKAIIDVEQAFADGQVYVALSRLRSLNGLILRTRISTQVISTDKQVAAFTSDNHRPEQLANTIKDKQREYILERINKTFDFEEIGKEIQYVMRGHQENTLADETMQPVLQQIANALAKEKSNTQTFRAQLHSLLETRDTTALLARLQKGSAYYRNLIWDQLKLLVQHREEMQHQKRMKAYQTSLSDIDQLLFKKLEEVDKVVHLTSCILAEKYDFDFSAGTQQRTSERLNMLQAIREKTPPPSKKKKKGSKKSKGEPRTHDVTFTLFKAGKSVKDIAEERGLSISTIESHMISLIEDNRIDIHDFISVNDFAEIVQLLIYESDASLSQLYAKAEGKFSYAKLRAVIAYKNRADSKNSAG
ncbi:MAG TPA: helix-turn-helix domain-containing protein [Ohtaekwangia sp.]